MTKEEFDLKMEEAEIKAKTAGKKAISFLPSILLILVAVALTSIASLFQYNFDLSEIILMDLIVFSTLRITVMFLSKYVGADMRYQRDVSDEDVAFAQKNFMDLSRALDRGEFDKWIKNENRDAKISAYREKIAKKLEKTNVKRRKIEFRNARKPKQKWQKKLISLEEKESDLKYRQSDEYIVENIAHIKVKYQHLHATDFLSPNEYSVKVERYGMSENLENIKEITKGIPFALMIIVLGAMVTFDVSKGTINAMSMLIDLGSILFYFLQGWSVVGRKTIALLITVYECRLGVIERFRLHQKNAKIIPEKSPNFSKKEVFEKNEKNEENKEND
jgi:hypothetical protein